MNDISGGRQQRGDMQFFLNPLNPNIISNVLHVLFGQIPVASLRRTIFTRVDYLYEKACNSYLHVNTYSKDGVYPSEMVLSKKSVTDSHNPITIVTWFRVKELLDDSIFAHFVSEVDKILKIDSTKLSFIEVAKMMKDNVNKFENLFAYLKTNEKAALTMYILEGSSQINQINRTKFLVHNGINTITRISGTILVPVNEDDIARVERGKGVATILDGGLLTISRIIDEDYIDDVHKYKLVGDISTETY